MVRGGVATSASPVLPRSNIFEAKTPATRRSAFPVYTIMYKPRISVAHSALHTHNTRRLFLIPLEVGSLVLPTQILCLMKVLFFETYRIYHYQNFRDF